MAMTYERKKEILNVIKLLCDTKGEAYPLQIANASNGKISFVEATTAMKEFADEGLVELDELEFSCTVEYYIYEVTEKGLQYLSL